MGWERGARKDVPSRRALALEQVRASRQERHADLGW